MELLLGRCRHREVLLQPHMQHRILSRDQPLARTVSNQVHLRTPHLPDNPHILPLRDNLRIHLPTLLRVARLLIHHPLDLLRTPPLAAALRIPPNRGPLHILLQEAAQHIHLQEALPHTRPLQAALRTPLPLDPLHTHHLQALPAILRFPVKELLPVIQGR